MYDFFISSRSSTEERNRLALSLFTYVPEYVPADFTGAVLIWFVCLPQFVLGAKFEMNLNPSGLTTKGG